MRSSRVLAVAALLVGISFASGARAQWLDLLGYRAAGVPRTADGRPDLTAPIPRTADGKPDLSGVWAAERNRQPGSVGSGFVTNVHGGNIATDLPGGAPLTPWARSLYNDRRGAAQLPIPTERCLPSGIPPDMLRPHLPFEIIQTPKVTVILLEEFNNWRQIHTDGRELPEDPQPAWFGYSVGRWEGDIFVATTTGFNDQTWLDGGGTPHSEQLRLTERLKRTDYGHMEIAFTFDDPKAFTKPWSATVRFELQADSDLMDHQCENDKWRAGSK